jgi:hypothetical protein
MFSPRIIIAMEMTISINAAQQHIATGFIAYLLSIVWFQQVVLLGLLDDEIQMCDLVVVHDKHIGQGVIR